jgi:hypothetical protein
MAGRPPLYSSPAELQHKIDEYFQWVKGERFIPPAKFKKGTVFPEWIREPEAITITGLCIYIGFDSRQSFYDYEQKEEFAYIIKAARLKVENWYEKKLINNSVTGSIFALKNMGWKDESAIDHTSKGEAMTPVIKIGYGSKDADL